MSTTQRKADFITNVVKTAILDGWTKDEFLSLGGKAWDFMTAPGPGQWGPMQGAAPETSAALDRTQGGLLPEGKTYFVGETPEGQS